MTDKGETLRGNREMVSHVLPCPNCRRGMAGEVASFMAQE